MTHLACKRCGAPVLLVGLRAHAASHVPAAWTLDPEEIRDAFEVPREAATDALALAKLRWRPVACHGATRPIED